MLSLCSLNRFVLISLALLAGCSVSAAHAAIYELKFTTHSIGGQSSSYFSNPEGTAFVDPNTHLVDVFFEASLGSGVILDDPNRFRAILSDANPDAGKITQVNLYNYGKRSPSYNPYSAEVPTNYFGEIIDAFIPRDGQVDAQRLEVHRLRLPSHLSHPDPATGLPIPEQPLFTYSLLGDMQTALGQDRLIFQNQSLLGDWTIREVSAIPVPATVWLFGTALIGLAGFSKRRKTS